MVANLLIPRLEFNDQTVTGTISNLSATITAVSDTSKLVAGMIIVGIGIPLNTTILSTTVNTIVMSANATTGATESISFFERFDFPFPEDKNSDEQLTNDESYSRSLTGQDQVIQNFIEAQRSLSFNFISLAQKNIIRDRFFINTASKGISFRFFPNFDNTAIFFTYTLKTRKFPPVKTIKKYPDFLYSFKIDCKRIINV